MHHASITERVGHYVVTPLTHTTASGKVSAAVSIRRGVYDRVFRFIDQFDSRASAPATPCKKAAAWCCATS